MGRRCPDQGLRWPRVHANRYCLQRAGSEAVARNRAAYVAAKHKVIAAEQRDPPF